MASWGRMLVQYAAGGDIAGVRKALASGCDTLAYFAGEAYWVAAGKGQRSIMALIENKFIISDEDRSTARRRAKAFGHDDCVTQVDNAVMGSSNVSHSNRVCIINIHRSN